MGDAGSPVEREAVARVIRDQVDALRNGDWTRAYRHSARELASQLSPGEFRRMVEAGYAPLLEAAAVRVEHVELEGDAAAARLSVVAQDGGVLGARYELAREDGVWRVAGVVLGASLTAVVSLNGHAGERRAGP
jgi:Domain of unknown function (DUF4864)